MASLYTLTDEYQDLLIQLEQAETDEEAESIWAALDSIGGDIANKAEAYAKIMKIKQAEAAAFKAEKDRLAASQKAAETVVERLKSMLMDSMLRLNVTDIQTGIGKWKIQLNPVSCTVVDESQVPEEFRIPQPDKIDRAGITKHFKATGELIPGVEMKQEPGLRFR